MNTKNFLTSKTVVVNLLALAIALYWGNSFDVGVMNQIADNIQYWLPVAGIILRFVTTKKIVLN